MISKQKLIKENVLLLNDTTQWYHWGCTGTSSALKTNILKKELNLVSIPINETYTWTLAPSSAKEFSDKKKFEIFSKNYPLLIQKIQNSDIVVINGEGTLHGVRPAPLNLLYVSFISKFFFNKKVQIINHSVFPQDNLDLDNKNIIEIYKLVYEAMDYIAVRENLSSNILKKLNVNHCLSFDSLPLYIKEFYREKIVRKENKVLISGSALWANLSMHLRNENSNLDSYKHSIHFLVQYINVLFKKGYEVHYLWGAQAFPAKDDIELIAQLKKNKAPIHFIEAKSLNEWLSHIQEASLLISGRFHHSIAAAVFNTPMILLNSNTPKIEAISKILNLDEPLKYTDKNLLKNLLDRTNEINSQDFIKNKNLLDNLCTLAVKNFKEL